jgi:parvulin-like peptidyl-prolyl isomerase
MNFDSLISINKNLSSKDIEVKLGSLADEEIEDLVYSLKINQFTQPIKSEIGWVLFRLKDKILTPIDITNKETIRKIEDVVKERRIRNRYEQYLKELLSKITININPEPFNFIANNIWLNLKKHTSNENKPNYFELTEADFEYIINFSSKSRLDESLFNIADKKISNESFLSQLAFDGFSTDKLDSVAVLKKLEKRVKQFVESQLITNEAYSQQLNLSEAVRNDLSKWREKYLAKFYFVSVLDSIKTSENDVYNFYLNQLQEKSNLQLVNVRILTLKDLDTIAVVLDEIKSGKDFGEIVKTYGRTDSLVNILGETNLRPIISLGYIGSIVTNLKINEIYGPVQRQNSYSLLQVIERKEPNDSVQVSFESIKNQLKEKLRLKLLADKLNETTAKLAERNDVKIFSDQVSAIKNPEIPMFLHRLMGFGGRIAGMPLVTPFSGWIKNINKQKLFP